MSGPCILYLQHVTSRCEWPNAEVLKKSNTHTHRSSSSIERKKKQQHSAKEIFNFPTPVSMLFYLSSFDLQTDQSCALGATVQKGDWVVCVFCFIGMLASNGTNLLAILHFTLFKLMLEKFATRRSSLRPPMMMLKQDQCQGLGSGSRKRTKKEPNHELNYKCCSVPNTKFELFTGTFTKK